MFRPNLLSMIVAIAVVCPQGALQAQTERDLDSHEHGAANINVVIDGKTVFVEFESPWNNLVGFEHKPSTDAQRQAVENAMQKLAAPATLFVFNDSADCHVSSAEIKSTLDTDDHHAEHDDHKDEHDEHHGHDDEHEDEHDEHHGHDDEHKDEHDEHHGHDDEHKDEHHEHDDEHADHGDEVHSEVIAAYTYDCTKPNKIEAVQVKLFDIYSGFESIAWQAAGPSGQTGAALSASNSTLDLSAVR